MAWLLAGRRLQGMGGGALVGYAFVSVERFSRDEIWPQLFGPSAVWGVAAFSGPLAAPSSDALGSWRWAFGMVFIGGELVVAAGSLRGCAARAAEKSRKAPPLPAWRPLSLGERDADCPGRGRDRVGALVAVSRAGLPGLVLFLRLDARRPVSRLFPSTPFDLRTNVGAGMAMIAAFRSRPAPSPSMARCSYHPPRHTD